jgi:hypothetical protein
VIPLPDGSMLGTTEATPRVASSVANYVEPATSTVAD